MQLCIKKTLELWDLILDKSTWFLITRLLTKQKVIDYVTIDNQAKSGTFQTPVKKQSHVTGNIDYNTWLMESGEVFLPPASVVEVIESEPSFRLSICVCVCQHSQSRTVWPMTLISYLEQQRNEKRAFGQKDCTMGGTQGVRERSGVFIAFFCFSSWWMI